MNLHCMSHGVSKRGTNLPRCPIVHSGSCLGISALFCVKHLPSKDGTANNFRPWAL